MLPYRDDFLLIIHGPSAEVREWLREATEAEVSAAALRVLWAMCLACDAACLPFGMVGELRRKLSPIVLLVLLLFMGVDLINGYGQVHKTPAKLCPGACVFRLLCMVIFRPFWPKVASSLFWKKCKSSELVFFYGREVASFVASSRGM